MLRQFSKKISRFLANDDGPTAVEYAILLAIISGTIVASVSYVGLEAKKTHESIATTIDDSLNN